MKKKINEWNIQNNCCMIAVDIDIQIDIRHNKNAFSRGFVENMFSWICFNRQQIRPIRF